MVTDKQFEDLKAKFEELHRQFAILSRDMAEIQMKLGTKNINHQETSLQDEPARVKKDITRYRFNGKLLNKRQLVLDCIQKYVEDHSGVSYSEIKEIFPDFIQGSLGIIRSIEEAERYKDATDHFFFGDSSVITLDNKYYVVCKDWTVQNIEHFIDVMTNLGYEISIIKRN